VAREKRIEEMNRWLRAAALAASLATSSPAVADPLRLLVAVSNSNGAPGELQLHHAADDARQVGAVLTSLGGFRPVDVSVLDDPTLADLDAAIEHASVRAATHAPEEVTFVFYFSGHGDRDRIHLGKETLDMAALSARVRAVPAGLRVLVTDACRTYPTRTKGMSTEPGFEITSSPTNASGVVWLFASGEGEPAQESDELRGALFTHYWVSALRGAGDANGDGRVTVAESYDFAYSQTLFRSARGSGVLQHPAAIFDLRAAAPVVLTSTADGATLLRFPRAADAHYLAYAIGSRAVVGEIWGSAEHEATFALPPGRYLIERRTDAGAAGVEVTLSTGETRSLGTADFRALPEEELASKGGEAVLRPDEIEIAAGVGASRLETVGELVSLRYAHSWGAWAFGLGVTGALGSGNTSAENVQLTALGGDATLERRWRAGGWTAGLGGGVEADVIGQMLTRTDAARVAAGGYPTTEHYEALAPGPIVAARLRLGITQALWAELGLRGAVLFPELDGTVGPLWTVEGGVGVGVSF
jgi:caspase domain-containing protein